MCKTIHTWGTCVNTLSRKLHATRSTGAVRCGTVSGVDAANRRPRKDDAARGPLGAWTYRTIADLGLSSEQVAVGLGVSAATIRKIAGGSYAAPPARLINALYAYFAEVGTSRTPPVAVDPPPGLNQTAAPPGETTGGAAALLELAQAISQMAEQLKAMLDRVDLDRVEDNSARIRALEAQVASVWQAIHPEPANDGASSTRHAPQRKGE